MERFRISCYREMIEPKGHEKFTKPSITIPDESLSVHEILLNFTRGTVPAVQKQPQYADEEYNEHLINTDSPLDDAINDLSYTDDVNTLRQSLLENHHLESSSSEPETDPTSNEPAGSAPLDSDSPSPTDVEE